MFKSIKLFIGQTVAIDDIIRDLVFFKYQRVKRIAQEGEFAHRGEVLDIFPVKFDNPVRIAFDFDTIRSIESLNMRSDRPIGHHQIAIILPKKLPHEGHFSANTPLNHFIDIEQGDFVVHTNHGIGKFLGIQPVEVNAVIREHLVIEYREGDKLFVPKNDVHLIQKYAGFSKKNPRMHKLGTKEWQRVKLNIQKKIQRAAAELLRVQALRASLKGFAFSKDTAWQKEFENNFPFEETPDQKTAIQKVKNDMESESPMDRLICGDVGFGKTEVAVRAAFKAVMDNKQVALLVPTTILAEQHFYNFSERMKSYPINIKMLSRFRSRSEQLRIINGLRDGTVDIVIGTHRLLSKDVGFKNLGLMIVDEEQRFGVRAKERLKHLRILVDVLTMTATPIPRTLYMALSGVRDMSVISTPPQNRVPVLTEITEYDDELILKAINRELDRKGQTFFLHNRVDNIDTLTIKFQKLLPGARVAYAHGQMSPRLLEEIMLKFLKHEIDVLFCTTIIESGIDIPNANTLIINRADRFGLSDLHQLRGRVGRFSNQAYAYFLVPPERILSQKAKDRLRALEKYSELGAGFQIAFEDLQIRGAGNLLGEQQSGYIAAIGFDMYCRLLKESVESLKDTMHLHGEEGLYNEKK
ncbi:MAG: transcription-repair coupling factor [Candidatus Omnitrophota bacterium]